MESDSRCGSSHIQPPTSEWRTSWSGETLRHRTHLTPRSCHRRATFRCQRGRAAVQAGCYNSSHSPPGLAYETAATVPQTAVPSAPQAQYTELLQATNDECLHPGRLPSFGLAVQLDKIRLPVLWPCRARDLLTPAGWITWRNYDTPSAALDRLADGPILRSCLRMPDVMADVMAAADAMALSAHSP